LSPYLDADEELGLRYLASIFRPLNEVFFAVWNGSTEDCTKEWLLRLERDVRTALPPVLEVSNEETANVRISQFWLQTKLWELFPRFGFLSTESVYECLKFGYPIILARDLTILAMKLPISSLQVHGIGMVRSFLLILLCY
jgi:SP family general alpha glucoside:H+ symporter-like MFS transporter